MSELSKTQLGSLIGRITLGYAWDQLRRPRASDPRMPPRAPMALTVDWLTAALCGGHPGAAVTSFTLGKPSHGTTTRQQLCVTYNRHGTDAGLPTSIFTKSTPSLKTRLVAGIIGAQRAEANYYTHARPAVAARGIEGPDGYYAVSDERSCRSLMLLEDVTARVAEFGDPNSLYVDRAMAESMVTLLGQLHGANWASPALEHDLTWLTGTRAVQQYWNAVIPFRKRSMVGFERFRLLASPEFLRTRDRLWPAFERSLQLNGQGPQTLVHQDVHLGNWYVTHDRRMGLYDFQGVARGNGAIDVAYMLMSALTVEDRRAWERELVELYLETLAAAGAAPPTFAAAWLAYRQQTFHGLFYWLFTIGYSRLMQQMQSDEICNESLARMSTAVTDLRSLAALDERAG